MQIPYFQKIAIEEKADLKSYITSYLQELGVAETEYKYLDSYWMDKNRIPLYFYFQGRKIGFALINEYCLVQDKLPSYSIAEFYIFKNERRNHFGKMIAHSIFDFFSGNWEIRTLKNNESAALFWENVISEYSSSYQKIGNHSSWDGLIFIFEKNNN